MKVKQTLLYQSNVFKVNNQNEGHGFKFWIQFLLKDVLVNNKYATKELYISITKLTLQIESNCCLTHHQDLFFYGI